MPADRRSPPRDWLGQGESRGKDVTADFSYSLVGPPDSDTFPVQRPTMARELKYASGQSIGRWTLVTPLGIGGNAEVWQASSDSHEEVALKLLAQRKVDAEPYRRFRDEIEVLRRVANVPGVLPLIDFNLPSEPSRSNPAWLSMPVAELARNALGESPDLMQVVLAVQAFADVLSLLHERAIYHRDIKPANLYRHKDHWCVGDFGLAAFPDKESVTSTAGHIGPIYYLAPELLLGKAVEPGPSDVFALGKTLWVLASGQSHPLPGNLAQGNELTRLSTFVADDRIRPIELLLERATETDPHKRPTMRDFASELRNWVQGTTPIRLNSADFSGLRHRLRSAVASHTQVDAARRHRQGYVIARLEEIKLELQSVGQIIDDLTGLTCTYGALGMFTEGGLLKEVADIPNYDYRHHVALMVQIPVMRGMHAEAVTLLCGLALMSTSDGSLEALAAHRIHVERATTETIWAERIVVPLESATERVQVSALCGALLRELPHAMNRLNEVLTSH
jgi:hypothetical protein